MPTKKTEYRFDADARDKTIEAAEKQVEVALKKAADKFAKKNQAVYTEPTAEVINLTRAKSVIVTVDTLGLPYLAATRDENGKVITDDAVTKAWELNPRDRDEKRITKLREAMDGYIKPPAEILTELGDGDDVDELWTPPPFDEVWGDYIGITLDGKVYSGNHSLATVQELHLEVDVWGRIKVRVMPVMGDENARMLASVSNRHGESFNDKAGGGAEQACRNIFLFSEVKQSWATVSGVEYLTADMIAAKTQVVGRTVAKYYVRFLHDRMVGNPARRLESFVKLAVKQHAPSNFKKLYLGEKTKGSGDDKKVTGYNNTSPFMTWLDLDEDGDYDAEVAKIQNAREFFGDLRGEVQAMRDEKDPLWINGENRLSEFVGTKLPGSQAFTIPADAEKQCQDALDAIDNALVFLTPKKSTNGTQTENEVLTTEGDGDEDNGASGESKSDDGKSTVETEAELKQKKAELEALQQKQKAEETADEVVTGEVESDAGDGDGETVGDGKPDETPSNADPGRINPTPTPAEASVVAPETVYALRDLAIQETAKSMLENASDAELRALESNAETELKSLSGQSEEWKNRMNLSEGTDAYNLNYATHTLLWAKKIALANVLVITRDILQDREEASPPAENSDDETVGDSQEATPAVASSIPEGEGYESPVSGDDDDELRDLAEGAHGELPETETQEHDGDFDTESVEIPLSPEEIEAKMMADKATADVEEAEKSNDDVSSGDAHHPDAADLTRGGTQKASDGWQEMVDKEAEKAAGEKELPF